MKNEAEKKYPSAEMYFVIILSKTRKMIEIEEKNCKIKNAVGGPYLSDIKPNIGHGIKANIVRYATASEALLPSVVVNNFIWALFKISTLAICVNTQPHARIHSIKAGCLMTIYRN